MKRVIFICSFLAALVLALPLARAGENKDSECYKCHPKSKTSFAQGTVHEPVVDGDCGACHADHGDKNKLVLKEEVPQLCYGCHDEPSKTHRHSPVSEGDCLDCHASHSSSSKPLLIKTSDELCADCHDGMDRSKGKHPHDPVAGGECTECHSSHESDQNSLLKSIYKQDRYGMFTIADFELCFNCHDKEGFESKDTQATEFRHGLRNLHFLHVFGLEEVNKYGMKKKREGMSCSGCHVTHGTEQPDLVRTLLQCGSIFCYTMNFRKFDGGGGCIVGCHKPRVYLHNPKTADTAIEESALATMAQKEKAAEVPKP